ncbi:MAG: nitrate ABC transporter, permease protein, partial [Burkholderiales bacterium]
MNAFKGLQGRAAVLSLLILITLVVLWHASTAPRAPVVGASAPAVTLTAEQIEYAKLMGKDPGATSEAATSQKSGFPTLVQMGST